MALSRYINHHARHDQVVDIKIMNRLSANDHVAWRIHMRADPRMHFDFHDTEFILALAIRIIDMHIMIKPAPPWPTRNCALECVGEIDEEIGAHDQKNAHYMKIRLRISKVPHKENHRYKNHD